MTDIFPCFPSDFLFMSQGRSQGRDLAKKGKKVLMTMIPRQLAGCWFCQGNADDISCLSLTTSPAGCIKILLLTICFKINGEITDVWNFVSFRLSQSKLELAWLFDIKFLRDCIKRNCDMFVRRIALISTHRFWEPVRIFLDFQNGWYRHVKKCWRALKEIVFCRKKRMRLIFENSWFL